MQAEGWLIVNFQPGAHLSPTSQGPHSPMASSHSTGRCRARCRLGLGERVGWRGIQPALPQGEQASVCSPQPGSGPSPSRASLLSLSLCSNVRSYPMEGPGPIRGCAQPRGRAQGKVGLSLRKQSTPGALPPQGPPPTPGAKAGRRAGFRRAGLGGHSQIRGFSTRESWERKWSPRTQDKGQGCNQPTGATARCPGSGTAAHPLWPLGPLSRGP